MDYPDRKIFPSAIPGQEFKRSRAVVAALLALELEGTVTVDGKAVSPEHFLEVGEGGKMIFSSQPALKNFGAEVKRLFDQAARALAMKQDAQTPFNEIVAVLNPQKPTPQKKLTPRPWEVDINQVSVESLLPAIEYIVSDTANLLGLDESTFTKFDPEKGWLITDQSQRRCPLVSSFVLRASCLKLVGDVCLPYPPGAGDQVSLPW